MSQFDEMCKAIHDVAEERAAKNTRLMVLRIHTVRDKYINQYNQCILDSLAECKALGISEDDDERKCRVLTLMLASRGIDLTKQAELPFEEGNGHETGPVAQETAGTAGQAEEGDRGQGRTAGQDSGSIAGRPGEDGASTQSRGRRKRRAAGNPEADVGGK